MDRFLEIVLVLAIFGVTLPFGGVQPVAYSVMEVVVLFAGLLVLIKQAREGTLRLLMPVWPIAFVLLVVVQLIPCFGGLLRIISPAVSSHLVATSSTLPPVNWATISIYPHATMEALLKLVAYLTAFFLAATFFDSRTHKSILIRALIVLGCLEAAYGMIQYLTGWQKIFTFTKQYDLEEATGTYINRSHYAGLLELIIPFVLASLFYSFLQQGERRRAIAASGTAPETSPSIFQPLFYLFLLTILMVALIFSRSRGGLISALLALVSMALLAQLRIQRKTWMAVVFAFLLVVVAYGLWIGFGPVLIRYEGMTDPSYLQMEGRVRIWKDAIRLIKDYPVLGTGLGTFGIAFRAYQTELVNYYVNHAHNDYLEFTSDTGLIGATLLFLPIFYLLGKMIVAFLYDPRRYRRSVTLGCIGSALAILIHSVTDFNLQIPANALIFSVVLGIGYKAVFVEPREARNQPPQK